MKEYLQERKSVLEDELKTVQEQKNAIDQHLALVQKKLDLVRQMLLLETGGIVVDVATAAPSGSDVRELARKIIKDSGKPLHISEIHRQFVERGYRIPGEGTPFNILAHIVRDKAFARVARGTYSLSADTPPEAILPIIRKKTRRRRSRP